MINERFRNPAQFSADATICAVASMAHLEVINFPPIQNHNDFQRYHTYSCFQNLAGTPEGAKMHIDGLETMINAKGGFGTIDPDNISRRLSAWSVSLRQYLPQHQDETTHSSLLILEIGRIVPQP